MKKICLMKTQSIVLFLIAGFCINMGMGGDKVNTVRNPSFTALESGAKSYRAIIIDDGKETEVKDISIGGRTNFIGIRRESDNSVMEIDFSKIKELDIKNQAYFSERFSDQEFVLVDCMTIDGSRLINLLFPRNLVISAVSMKPEIKYSWYLRSVQKIIFQGLSQAMY